jgi:hypothetical protein
LVARIGELFGGLDYAAVAQRIRRTKSSHNAIGARRLIGTMLNCLDLTAMTQRVLRRSKATPYMRFLAV